MNCIIELKNPHKLVVSFLNLKVSNKGASEDERLNHLRGIGTSQFKETYKISSGHIQ
ncbi:MAG: hypothetical protein H5T39_01935 [Methanobacteriales archaeon]|nr:MAG: hypothetical protein XD44_0348 [Methanobacteriaceae archaeon 41_258]MBC7089087.1 hypothetical protein [Methanobacteriaceae archaeon]MBC7096443.1 hypothetical protein [Methanobacteriales archaeon]